MIMQTLQFENEFFKNHGCKPAAKVFFSLKSLYYWAKFSLLNDWPKINLASKSNTLNKESFAHESNSLWKYLNRKYYKEYT